MRTIRVELEIPTPAPDESPLAAMFGGGGKIHVTTEVIVADDGNAREAGDSAARFLTEFITGYGDAE